MLLGSHGAPAASAGAAGPSARTVVLARILDSITLDPAVAALVQTLSASAGQLRYLNQPDFAKELAVANALFGEW